jgi:AcrR family transcriptional regulator
MKSAMIAYYFKSKEGLFIALVEYFASENLQNMQSAVTSDEPIRGFIEATIKHLSENPALSRFIADEILFQDSHLAEAILDALPRKVAVFLPNLIQDMKDKGMLRSNLEPRWAAFSLMNMVLMPFVAAKVRDNAWQISHQEVASPEWIDHIYRLFMAGCGGSSSIS